MFVITHSGWQNSTVGTLKSMLCASFVVVGVGIVQLHEISGTVEQEIEHWVHITPVAWRLVFLGIYLPR